MKFEMLFLLLLFGWKLLNNMEFLCEEKLATFYILLYMPSQAS